VEYIRADIPYRKNSMMLWIWIIGGFAFIIFVMMALTKVYSRIGRRRRRK
jgi:uncharacterized membrane protein